MPLLWLLLPFLLFKSFRVVSADPRVPAEQPGTLGVLASTAICLSPALFISAPASPLFNACLALGLSTLVSPMLFSAMSTGGHSTWIEDKAAWLRDKIFVLVVRTLAAAAIAVPLIWLDRSWFYVLAALALVSFISRWAMWNDAGGSSSKYGRAVFFAFCGLLAYSQMVNASELSPENWTDWRGFLSVPNVPTSGNSLNP